MKMNRRQFLGKSSVLGGASLALGPDQWLRANESGAVASELPDVPYGAVYFRKTAPPKEDWERDYAQAAKDGMNTFRHWFIWAAIEVAPGKYDWSDYDRQFDLAEKYGISTVVGEILTSAPQWAFDKFPHAQMEAADGRKVGPHYSVAAAVGGWPGLCLDDDDVLEIAEEFLRQLVLRYKDHPAMGAYDLWNELNQLGDAGGSYSAASAEKFRAWLKEKYGDLETLGKAWYRYSYTDWSQVRIPRTIGNYPDANDWGLFRIDNAMRLFERRVKLVRELDPDHPITNHTIPMGAIEKVHPGTYPEGGTYPVFPATKLVDISGFSGGGNHDDRYKLRWGHWMKMDITRSASRGKPFWASEITVGNTWPMASLKKLDEGRITTAEDVRFYTLMNLAGGTRGLLSPRWRPLLDGKSFGNFAFYAMDGSPTERSEAAREMIDWLARDGHRSLLAAKPVKSDIGLLIVPDSQIHTFCSQGSTAFYSDSVEGAYQAMLFNNLQVEFVPPDDIPEDLEVLYLPFPAMLPAKVAETLKNWVRNGGILISEGCPGYFGDLGRAGTSQPNHGLDELFGARESFVQYTPDLLTKLEVELDDGKKVDGGIYLQAYEPTTGKPFAHYEDGRIAGVDNVYGQGKTRLLGTFPGYRFRRTPNDRTRQYFADVLRWTGKTPQVICSNPNLITRLQTHQDDNRTYLWITNATRQPETAEIQLPRFGGEMNGLQSLSGEDGKLLSGNALRVTVPARDVTIVEIQA